MEKTMRKLLIAALLVLLAVTLLICHLLILFMRKYMPHITAQKDVIKI